ncbi:lysylphosphatidylglycerol synthase transmembrane domain-containing protein [Lentzea sp. BCCO 10_0798]|uniref:Lysylphosphatidylglycerol synthase transmembrane domain-containing protein n=1 Tax=Lentzea kristufekii TaxID=3095430 RepID=A0ABU4TXV3_9PSEU|nr:lysylphosphatidylglycerol synthase transmembrane domain-containing protein [Lentzea sp. BCCO 10_0798]MDX8052651.1 lysylphosphatidylglycerol synthase transmembrane domain-containing protein [Lentzea sp. BCCO 10_0798]
MKKFWPWLRLVLALGILVALGVRLGTGAFVDGLRAIDAFSVAAALAIGLVTTVLSAGRWVLVARRLGLPLTLRTAVSDYYRAQLVNAVLPAGVLGDVHRAVNHGRESGDVGRGVRAVFFERFAGQIVLIGIGLAVLLTHPAPGLDLAPDGTTAALVLAGLAVLTAVGWNIRPVRKALVNTLADGIRLLSLRTWPAVIGLSAATVAGYVAMFLVAARAAGSDATITQLAPVVVLALLIMAIPVNIGGFGPREAFLAVAFGAAGLGAAQGFTTGIVYGVLALIAALPGAVVLFLSRRAKTEQVEVVAEGLGQPREQELALAR